MSNFSDIFVVTSLVTTTSEHNMCVPAMNDDCRWILYR